MEVPLARVPPYRTPVDDKTIGQQIRLFRRRRGLSQAVVATALGVHQSLVSEYERGSVRVPATVLVALAGILRARLDEFVGPKLPDTNGVPQDRRFIRRLERIEKLPKRSKQALLKTIDTYLDGSEKP